MKAYQYDIFRYYGRYRETFREKLGRPACLKYLILFRKCSGCSSVLQLLYRWRLKQLTKKTFIQIPYTTVIGKGCHIAHEGSVIVNPCARIGRNCNIGTGVIIGQENRGSRKGAPTIGDSVWIGGNAVIVGNVTIGDDVLIAPLTYVNFDVPSHSVVIGNPGRIHPNANATEGYINRTV